LKDEVAVLLGRVGEVAATAAVLFRPFNGQFRSAVQAALKVFLYS
jgi:hypothetical protein